jgi:hypothetical protein
MKVRNWSAHLCPNSTITVLVYLNELLKLEQ